MCNIQSCSSKSLQESKIRDVKFLTGSINFRKIQEDLSVVYTTCIIRLHRKLGNSFFIYILRCYERQHSIHIRKFSTIFFDWAQLNSNEMFICEYFNLSDSYVFILYILRRIYSYLQVKNSCNNSLSMTTFVQQDERDEINSYLPFVKNKICFIDFD